jgi:CBS domain-containing protein
MSLTKVARVPAATVAPDATVIEAVRRMEQDRVGAVAIVRGDALVGMFTERDLMTRVVLAGKDATTTKVAEVMTADVMSVAPDTSIAGALRLMVERHFRHLPIVDGDKKLLGMLSMRHLLRQRVDILTSELEGVANYAGADGIGG